MTTNAINPTEEVRNFPVVVDDRPPTDEEADDFKALVDAVFGDDPHSDLD